MQIKLSPQLRRFVEQLIAEGRYASSDEVIAAALKSFADSDLRRQVQRGVDEVRRGLATDWDLSEVKQAFLRRARAKKKAS